MTYVVPKKQWTGAYLPNWLLQRQDISSNAKLVYARLAQFANQDGVAWPSQDTLAQECGISVRSIKSAIKELRDINLIESIQRGLRRSNQYRFLQHIWMECCPTLKGNERTSGSADPAPLEVQDSVPRQDVKEKTLRNKRGTRCPEDYWPDAKTLEKCVAYSSREFVEWEVDQFVSYWAAKSGKAAIKLNWDLTFWNWIKNDVDIYGKYAAFNKGKAGGNETSRRQTGLAAAVADKLATGA